MNPFGAAPTVMHVGAPRVRVDAIEGDCVCLVVECVGPDGRPVLTFQRAQLRVGSSLTLNDITINMQVTTKE